VKDALRGGMRPGGASLLTLVCHSCRGGGRHFHSSPKHSQGLKYHTFLYWNIHLQPRLISVGRGLVSILMDLSLSQIYLSDLSLFLSLTL